MSKIFVIIPTDNLHNYVWDTVENKGTKKSKLEAIKLARSIFQDLNKYACSGFRVDIFTGNHDHSGINPDNHLDPVFTITPKEEAEPDFVELGNEYARLVLASEYGINPEEEELTWEQKYYASDMKNTNAERQVMIERVFHSYQNYTLDQYVENLLESLGI